MNTKKDTYDSVSQKFLNLWKQRFKENMAAAQYDESEQTDEKFSSLLEREIWYFLPKRASQSDYLFNLVIMYLFPNEVKYTNLSPVYGIQRIDGNIICDECLRMLDENYKTAFDKNDYGYRKDEALKFKNSPDSAIGGRRTKRRKQKKRKTNKMMRIKQNTKMNKRGRTHKRR
jgi:hypothetical protein